MATTKISASEIAPYSIVGTLIGFTTGIVTSQELIGASRHPQMRIIKATVVALKIGAASNVSIVNGSTTMVTAVAANVVAVGDITALTIISNTDVVPSASSITLTTSGATDVFMWVLQYELVS